MIEEFDKKTEKMISNMALHMARVCVRNTVIEDFHAAGKLSQEDMKMFNKEVADKLYSYLQLYFNPTFQEDRKLLFSTPYFSSLPEGWDKPKFDKEFKKAIDVLKKR